MNDMKAATIALVLALPGVHAQPPSPLSFEVASIRPQDGPLNRIADYSASGPRLTLGGYSFPLLIMEAYDLKSYQMSFPSTASGLADYYNVTAIAPGVTAPTRDDFRQMLQSLLVDRFKLKMHQETREMAVYALVVDKNGPSLKAAVSDDRCAARVGPLRPQDRNYRYQYTNCTLDPLVNTLQADRPIVDKTGLTGRYDITVFATPPYKMRDSSEPGDIPLEDAIRQLGLKLEPRKEPIEVLVVDHVEKPTEN
jgi:uncharacterized protein (TIGR03435 family)